MVAFLDDLEERGYVERRRNPTDRRLHALHLTPLGDELTARLSKLARAHDQLLTAALTPQQRAALGESLAIIAEQHDLTPGVHPGYRHLPAPRQNER
jgi:DNA-binding MarR family transcriptional regulator